MAYIPDPTNGAAPLGSEAASTAAAEFRALKTYIQGLVAGAVTTVPSVRQTVAMGLQDVNGDPAFLVAGAGLALNLVATAAPLALTYAAGTGPTGDVNFNEVVAADVVGVVAGLAASNLSYLYKTYAGAWGSTLAPVQYFKDFDNGAQALVRWPGANNAVVTTEDFGSAVTIAGTAKISTAVQILGGNTLALTGAAGGYASFPSSGLGSGSWEITGSFRLGAVGVTQAIITGGLGGGNFYGFGLYVDTSNKLGLYLSSNGISWDLAALSLGTTVLSSNTTYYFRLTYESNLARIYQLFLSVTGAAETQEIQLASFSKLAAISVLFIGATLTSTAPLTGNIGAISLRRFIKDTNGPLAAAPTVQPDYSTVAGDWFNTTAMRMFTPSGPSTATGVNPPMTASNKLYVGEVTTNANAIFSLVNYAYKGKYDSGLFGTAPAAAAIVSKSHNLGVTPEQATFSLECVTADQGYTPGDRIAAGVSGANATYGLPLMPTATSKQVQVIGGPVSGIYLTNKATGVYVAATTTSWKSRFTANRGW